MTDRNKIFEFIDNQKNLFWYIDKPIDKISDEVLVETVLNYGELESIKEMFSIIGIENVAVIFRNSIKGRRRSNYFPKVLNYFTLYFNKYAY